MAVESAMQGWELFFDQLSSFLQSADRQMQSRGANESFSVYVLETITVYCSGVSSLLEHMHATIEDGTVSNNESSVIMDYCLMLEELLQHMQSTGQLWNVYVDEIHQISHSNMYSAPSVSATHRRPGRPKFDISCDQLEYLSSMSFTWEQIASMLGVSRMTVYRRRIEYGLTSTSGSRLTDDELKILIQHISTEQPAMGETMTWGRLKSMGFSVTRRRLRACICEIDPIQRALRWRTQLVRRQPYSVPGPNSLWHIGENWFACISDHAFVAAWLT